MEQLREKRGAQFGLGLAFGIVPLVVWAPVLVLIPATPPEAFLWRLSLVLYGIVAVMSIACCLNRRVQYIGGGLLAAVILNPILAIWAMSVFIPNHFNS